MLGDDDSNGDKTFESESIDDIEEEDKTDIENTPFDEIETEQEDSTESVLNSTTIESTVLEALDSEDKLQTEVMKSNMGFEKWRRENKLEVEVEAKVTSPTFKKPAELMTQFPQLNFVRKVEPEVREKESEVEFLEAREVECPDCSKTFTARAKLLGHLVTAHYSPPILALHPFSRFCSYFCSCSPCS